MTSSTKTQKSAFPAWLPGTLFVLGGCCTNVLTLEAILSFDSGAANLITFCQYIFVAFVSCPRVLHKRHLPLSAHLIQTLLVFVSAVLNSYAFDFGISPLLHAIFRSASLVTNLLIGLLFFHKKTNVPQCLCVLAITTGVILATLRSSDLQHSSSDSTVSSGLGLNLSLSLAAGAGMWLMVGSLVVGAFQGHIQELAFSRYGRHLDEVLFYSHLLAIPCYLPLWSNLSTHALVFQARPILWAYLAMNVVTQWMCVRGVYMVMATAGSLTVNIVTTVRKLVSILLSVALFGNRLSGVQWCGAALVFGFSAWYGFLPKPASSAAPAAAVPKKKKDA